MIYELTDGTWCYQGSANSSSNPLIIKVKQLPNYLLPNLNYYNIFNSCMTMSSTVIL